MFASLLGRNLVFVKIFFLVAKTLNPFSSVKKQVSEELSSVVCPVCAVQCRQSDKDRGSSEAGSAMIVPNTNTQYGRLVFDSARLELWLRLEDREELVLSWCRGDCGLVISVPHAGRLGEDK